MVGNVNLQRQQIFELEQWMRTKPQLDLSDNGDLPIQHHFAPGLYSREIFIPAGVLLIGKIHKEAHLSIMLTGRMVVLIDNESVEIVAPIVETSPAGIKRVGVCIEDTRWLTIHATEETDLEKLKDLTTEDWNDVQPLLDKQDYDRFSVDFGMTEEMILALESVEIHSIAMQDIFLARSERHGTGVFSKGSISSGSFIADAVKDGNLTEWSRYMNHSSEPNARLAARSEGNLEIMAIRDIESEEITMNYRNNMWAELPIEGVV